ncbi:MAG: Eco57I restriction-modification methylase domain-containing protein [Patescibacteria group bacterium]
MNKARLETLINDYSAQNLGDLLYEAGFEARPQSLSSIVPHDTLFTECLKLGELKTVDNQKILVVETKVANDLSERSSRKRQFDIGKKILQSSPAYAAGLFVFYDEQRNLRLSLIYPIYQGTKRKFSPYKRFSFYVSKHLPNKTFRNQFEKNELRSLADFRKAFSLSAVTKKFYEEFKPEFDRLADSVIGNLDKKHPKLNEDFALLFIIRTIFVGFVQKRKWIANNENFLEWYWGQYKVNKTETTNFYNDWLMPLFFNAFNTPFGSDEAVENLNIPDDIKIKVKQSPYLNGGIFTSKNGVDTHELTIPDSAIETFFAFIFSYNFTIEENTAFDEDLELNPEFLGIIFEKLVNKDQGAIYTPRTEVDFMCRISLVKWLKKKLGDAVEVDNLYRLFFRETGNTDDQRYGDFSNNQKLQILEVLNKVTICDPAVGSGAFPVGMLQVLDEIDEVLRKDLEGGEVYRPYERKKEIIKNSLYGVEVKEWAVWITQLRLWITLFIDAPDSIKESQEPILPTLDFKIRQGDSLVQRLGSKLFPVQGVAGLGAESKRRLQNLIEYKRQVYENEVHGEDFRQREEILFKEILSEQVKAKRKELEILLKDGKPQQSGLFTDQDIDEQRQVTLFEKEREVLEAEMDDLQRELSALNSERPLIWSIEFAEIFSGDSTGFDIVIGNPPYVRQEEIGDPLGYVSSARSYKELLFQMVQQDEPLTREKDFKIDGKSDLYAFFYVRGLRLLNKEGVLTFICSNSWLDVGYGTWLQRLFLQNSSLEYVFDNHSERSFEEADVNTTINLFHAPKTKINKIIKFVAFKKPFEEIVHSDSLVAIEQANQIEKTEEYRVYPAEQSKLLEDSIETENSKQKFIGDKWGGKYLRAPDIYFTILEKGKDKLVKLKSIGDVKRGITTGANAFFYLTKERALELKIEEEFLFPVITSPRESRSVVINPDDLGYRILICNKTKKELAGTHILKYIYYHQLTYIFFQLILVR